MAKKKSSAEPQTVLERTYTIPLGRELLKVPLNRKAKKAVSAIEQFISKHMKSEDVRIQRALNDEVWKNGIKNPIKKVKVNATKDDKGVVRVNLFGAKEEPKAPKKVASAEKTATTAAEAGAAEAAAAAKPVEAGAKTGAETEQKPSEEKSAEEKAHQPAKKQEKAAAEEKEELSEQQEEQKRAPTKPSEQPAEAKKQPEQKPNAPDKQ